MSEFIDILEVPEGITAEQANEIEKTWLAKTGRRCIILSGGRYAGSVLEGERTSE